VFIKLNGGVYDISKANLEIDKIKGKMARRMRTN